MIMIRRAVPQDAEQIESLYEQLERDAVTYQPQHFVISPAGARSEQLLSMIGSETQTMFAAEEDGEVVGFAHVALHMAKAFSCLKPQSNIYLQDLVVAPEYRGKGIGTLLLNAAKEYGRENGAEFFRTQVFPMNADGLRFYRRNGFEVTMLTIECPL